MKLTRFSLRLRSRPGETLLSYIQKSTALMMLVTGSWFHNQDLGDIFTVLIECWLTIGNINVDMKQPTTYTIDFR